RLPVSRHALAKQLLELCASARGERPLRVLLRALDHGVDARHEADDDAERAQAIAVALVDERSAAGGDDRRAFRFELRHRLAFDAAELLLTVLLEDLGDRAPGALLDERIRVDEIAAETAREPAPDRALSRRHEACQHDVHHA